MWLWKRRASCNTIHQQHQSSFVYHRYFLLIGRPGFLMSAFCLSNHRNTGRITVRREVGEASYVNTKKDRCKWTQRKKEQEIGKSMKLKVLNVDWFMDAKKQTDCMLRSSIFERLVIPGRSHPDDCLADM